MISFHSHHHVGLVRGSNEIVTAVNISWAFILCQDQWWALYTHCGIVLRQLKILWGLFVAHSLSLWSTPCLIWLHTPCQEPSSAVTLLLLLKHIELTPAPGPQHKPRSLPGLLLFLFPGWLHRDIPIRERPPPTCKMPPSCPLSSHPTSPSAGYLSPPCILFIGLLTK